MKLELRKLEAPKIEGMEEMALNIASVTQRFIAEMQKQEEELFTTALRTIAEPPIKGEITKGKITWRGIRLIRQQVGFDSYSWLEQRGKQISPKFHIEAKLPDLNVG
jgi:translation initiation factor 2B subunit (eIF-2B alpha/beta/delta family)